MKKNLSPLKRPTSAPRAPLRTFIEMAEELGITEGLLKSNLGRSKDAPKPVLVSKNVRRGSNSWYDPVEMRRWWKSIQELKGNA
jgi:hypothetical protein